MPVPLLPVPPPRCVSGGSASDRWWLSGYPECDYIPLQRARGPATPPMLAAHADARLPWVKALPSEASRRGRMILAALLAASGVPSFRLVSPRGWTPLLLRPTVSHVSERAQRRGRPTGLTRRSAVGCGAETRVTILAAHPRRAGPK